MNFSEINCQHALGLATGVLEYAACRCSSGQTQLRPALLVLSWHIPMLQIAHCRVHLSMGLGACCLQMRFRPDTAEHDLQMKMVRVEEFLAKGHKVKLDMRFKMHLREKAITRLHELIGMFQGRATAIWPNVAPTGSIIAVVLEPEARTVVNKPPRAA